MVQYILDTNGVSWRKDLFRRFWYGDGCETVYASYGSGDNEVRVEFDSYSWDNPEPTASHVIPAFQPYFCVASWLDPAGELQHRCYPVIAWRHDGDWVMPLMPNSVRENYPSAILHPNGQVFENEKVWPSLEDYLADRGPELRERQRVYRARLDEGAAMDADAAEAEPA